MNRWFWWLYYGIAELLPMRCKTCGRWMQRKSSYTALHRTLGQVYVCRHCHDDLYPGGQLW